MPQFDIEPHTGVGPIKFGMNRQQVREALDSYPNNQFVQSKHLTLDYAFGNSLQIEYDSNGHVQFIGIGFYTGCGCDYSLNGRHIGDFSGNELFRKLAELDGDPKQIYNADQYYFHNLRMLVWEADIQYDYRGGETRPVYGQVGVASAQYEIVN